MELDREMMKNLTDEQLQTIEYYMENEMKKLKFICYPIINRKFVPLSDHDDLFDDAINVLLESVISFDESRGVPFEGYFKTNIEKSFWEWTRDSKRLKRCNVRYGKDKKPLKDEKGNYIVIPPVYIDKENEDGTRESEKIPSKFDINKTVIEESYSKPVTDFINSLSPLQRKIAICLSEGMTRDRICEELHITHSQYRNSRDRMFSYEKTRCLEPLVRRR